MIRNVCLVFCMLFSISCGVFVPVEERPTGPGPMGKVNQYLGQVRSWENSPEPSRERFIGLTTEGRSLFPKGRVLSQETRSALRRHGEPSRSQGVLSYLLVRRLVNNQEYRLELRTDRQGKVLTLVSVYPASELPVSGEQPKVEVKPVEPAPRQEPRLTDDNKVSSQELMGFLRHVIRGETEEAAHKGQRLFTAGALMPAGYGDKMRQYLRSRRQGTQEYVFYRTQFEGRGQECRLVVDEATGRVRSFAVVNL